MQLAVSLLSIAKSDWPSIGGKYINVRTAARYTHERDYEDKDLHESYLAKLYMDKAFHILWKWLDHNMKKSYQSFGFYCYSYRSYRSVRGGLPGRYSCIRCYRQVEAVQDYHASQ